MANITVKSVNDSKPVSVKENLAHYYYDLANASADVAAKSAQEASDCAKFINQKGAVCRIYDSLTSNDKEAYSKIYSFKYSKLDNSKFIKVGSPVISDNGIASGFSGSNYVNIPNTYSFTTSNNFELVIKFQINSIPSASSPMCRIATNNYRGSFGFLIGVKSQGRLYIDGFASSVLNFDALNVNTWYTLKIKSVQSNASFYLNNALIGTGTFVKNIPTGYITLGCGTGSDVFNIGSIDLKDFSFTEDGKNSYTPLKTGVDTVKPNNYTVVGSPNITDDGIVSNLTAQANYLKTSKIYIGDKNFKINFEFTTGQQVSEGYLFKGSTNVNDMAIWIGTNPNISVQINGTNALNISSNAYELNSTYKGYLERTNEGYKLYYENTATGVSKVAASTSFSAYPTVNQELLIGANSFYGSINLNAFQIYIDDNLVYQPCLKIPYTEAKTGAKIVDAEYRDRVNDWYEQSGEGNYYTIEEGVNEEEKNFTLPLPDIYGLIENKISRKNNQTVVETYYNNESWYRLWSDNWCEQGGVIAASNTTIALLKTCAAPFVMIVGAEGDTPIYTSIKIENNGTSVKLNKSASSKCRFYIAGYIL